MPKHVYTAIAQRAILDIQRNTVTLVDLIEELTIEDKLPNNEEARQKIGFGGFFIVSYWTRHKEDTPENFPVRIRIVAPNGKTLGSLKALVNLETHENGRIVAQIPPIPYRGTGRYEFITEHQVGERWRTIARYPIRVKERFLATSNSEH